MCRGDSCFLSFFFVITIIIIISNYCCVVIMLFVFWQLQSIMSKMLEHIHDFSILVSMVGS